MVSGDEGNRDNAGLRHIKEVGQFKSRKAAAAATGGSLEGVQGIRSQPHIFQFYSNPWNKMAAAKKSLAKLRPDDDKTDLKEIYIQPNFIKRFAFPKSQNHADPNIIGVPLDYSFRKVSSLSELEYGTPREYRVGIPRKGRSGKFVSSTLWANYNNLTDLNSVSSLVKVSFHKPEMIAWLDVSFNEIEVISNEILTLKNLKILYLHGNKIKYFIEVSKLKPLKLLRTLTLHGNPIVEHPNYRPTVIKTLPQLINLDFSLITK